MHLVDFTIEIQGDQKSLCTLYSSCNHQVHRDFLITLCIAMHSLTNFKCRYLFIYFRTANGTESSRRVLEVEYRHLRSRWKDVTNSPGFFVCKHCGGYRVITEQGGSWVKNCEVGGTRSESRRFIAYLTFSTSNVTLLKSHVCPNSQLASFPGNNTT